MTLEDIKQLTLREILFLTEGKFCIGMNKPTLANEEIIVHINRDFIERKSLFKKSDKK